MPRSTREWAQRKLEESNGNLDWAIGHLGEVAERYEEAHPEISGPIMEIIAVIVELQNATIKIRGTF